jgi:cell division protein FtsB
VRRKPKKPLTPLQQNRFLKIILGLVVASMIWLLFAPGTGVYSLLKVRNKTSRLEQETQELIQTNEDLQAEIERLKNDTAYLEQIAREKYGMLKKNERVFDFSRSKKADAEKQK